MWELGLTPHSTCVEVRKELFRSRFSPFTTWGPGLNTRFGSKHLYLLSHPASPLAFELQCFFLKISVFVFLLQVWDCVSYIAFLYLKHVCIETKKFLSFAVFLNRSINRRIVS